MSLEKYKEVFGSWYIPLIPVLTDSEFQKLGEIIAKRRKLEDVYPTKENVFRCFKETNYEKVKVIIWGMDPYPTKGVADGLAFSTKEELPTPKSLLKIHKAIEEDCYQGLNLNSNNDLLYLAEQGVLLLNSSLTVAGGSPGSHQEYWNWFTNEIVDIINNMLWDVYIISMGKVAQNFTNKIVNHTVQNVEHPAASVYRSGGKWKHDECFKKANDFLIKRYGESFKITW